MVFHYTPGQKKKKKDEGEYCLSQSFRQTYLILPSKQMLKGERRGGQERMLNPGLKVTEIWPALGKALKVSMSVSTKAKIQITSGKISLLTPDCLSPNSCVLIWPLSPSSSKGWSWLGITLMRSLGRVLFDVWRADRRGWFTLKLGAT